MWDHTKWGSATDPIHKSDLTKVVGPFACLQAMGRGKQDHAENGEQVHAEANGKMAAGNAVHSVLHRICKSAVAFEYVMSEIDSLSEYSLTVAYDEEFAKEVGGRPVSWFKTNADKHRDDMLQMIFGVVREMRKHVDAVIMAEAGFVYRLNGIWLTGAIDLLYKPKGVDGIGMTDWKTGAQKPHQIVLDHGWEAGVYGNAVKSAWFIPFDSVTPEPGQSHRMAMEAACIRIAVAIEAVEAARAHADELKNSTAEGEHTAAMSTLDALICEYGAVRFDEYPVELRLVHLRDYVPYKRKSAPSLSRPEELAWAGMSEPGKFPRVAGDQRGPGWYHIHRDDSHTPRLSYLLHSVVQWVRLGMFPAAPGEICSRCRFRAPCLVDGYQPEGEDRKQLEEMIKDFGGFDGLDNEPKGK